MTARSSDRGSIALLYGGKDRELLKWFPLNDTYAQPGKITVTDLPAYFKTDLLTAAGRAATPSSS